MTKDTIKSPYRSLTACSFMFDEMNSVLPLLMAENADELTRDEVKNNRVMGVNSQESRKKFMTEFRRRYAAVPTDFWTWYLTLDDAAKRVALMYVILKAYRLFFDFHFNVTVKRWMSVSQTLTYADIEMELNEIASRDEFVDSWSDETKHRTASAYLTSLRQSGFLDPTSERLHVVRLQPTDYAWYISVGEAWFLDACLLQRYEIKDIISKLP